MHRRTAAALASLIVLSTAAGCSGSPTPASTTGSGGTDGTATSSLGTDGTATSSLGTDGTATSSLVFPKDDYTEQTTTVTTDDGEVTVKYHSYEAITYVAKPVDATYESMNVQVPVEIDGKAVDATNSPILFDITVGGYMSSAVGAQTSGAGGGPGGDTSTDAAGSTDGSGADNGAAPTGGAMPEGETAPTDMPGGGTMPTDMPGGGTMPTDGATPGGNGAAGGFAGRSGAGNAQLALAAGYVVVTPGARGRDNQASDGTYYGKAPAAIVDLKAAVRYLHYNKGVIPGDTDKIVSSGTSAGGALSTLLGASAGSALYDADLAAIGAADAEDSIFAVAAYCPITDLDHADGAYEWTFGSASVNGGQQVDQTLSKELASQFADYQASLKLTGTGDLGTLTADNYGQYLLQAFLQPAATKYLAALSEADRTSYLEKNSWITWTQGANGTEGAGADGASGTAGTDTSGSDGAATFSLADFVTHVGRSKSLPAFDAFDLSSAEDILFGDETTNARHFTVFSLRQDTGDTTAELDADLTQSVQMMNPMYFIGQKNARRATHWWLRTGTSDTDTTPVVLANLSAGLSGLGDDVNALMYWDAGHGANEDAADFITWIGQITA